MMSLFARVQRASALIGSRIHLTRQSHNEGLNSSYTILKRMFGGLRLRSQEPCGVNGFVL